MACQTCTHYLPDSEESGLCRRFPPVVVLTPTGDLLSAFPRMQPVGACGEHKPKDE